MASTTTVSSPGQEEDEEYEDYEDDYLKLTTGLLIPFAILLTMLIIFAIVGNLLTIIAYVRDKRLHTVYDFYIFNLAITDLLLGAVSMPFYTVYTLTDFTWYFGDTFCKVYLVIDFTLCFESILLILLLSLDRLLLIIHGPHYSTKETMKKAYIKVILSWVISFLVYSPAIIGWDHWTGESVVEDMDCDVEFVNHFEFTTITAFIEFFLPFTCLSVVNGAIYYKIRKRIKVKQEKNETNYEESVLSKYTVSTRIPTMAPDRKTEIKADEIQQPLAENKTDNGHTETGDKTLKRRVSFSNDSTSKLHENLLSHMHVASNKGISNDTQMKSTLRELQARHPRSIEYVDIKAYDYNINDTTTAISIDSETANGSKEYLKETQNSFSEEDYKHRQNVASNTRKAGLTEPSTANEKMLTQTQEVAVKATQENILDAAGTKTIKHIQAATEIVARKVSSASESHELIGETKRQGIQVSDLNTASEFQTEVRGSLQSSTTSKPTASAVQAKQNNFQVLKSQENKEGGPVVLAAPAIQVECKMGHPDFDITRPERMSNNPMQTPDHTGEAFQDPALNSLKIEPTKRKLATLDVPPLCARSKSTMSSAFSSPPSGFPKKKKTRPSMLRRDTKAARFLAFLVIVFMICWAPYTITTIILSFCEYCVNKNFYEFLNWLLWMKSSINPLLYAYNSSRYRSNFKKFIPFCCRGNRITPASTDFTLH